ncbi:hypothetical protein [Roseovarius aestuarii]|uniref:Uncharacterized protein n=1 Tax=Roseovarius aestuarii TaxID=475083 RepID=A0A1X7BNC6_9RHOB|nr:hypothetical protein [Roseovarius aestuarii]SMC11116.1 hypothetical protein ROA7745_00925 [Roseovarius aestuarii]
MKPVKAALLSFLLTTSAAAQQPPLSAIDWLDELGAIQLTQPIPGEPAVTETALSPKVEVMPLDGAQADAVGLLPSSTTGLPRTLWAASATDDLTRQLSAVATDPLPALQALYYTLLLAEAEAPADAGQNALFLNARVDALMAFGAADPARALLDRAGPLNPALFDRWLDVSLLNGTEDEPCKALREQPSLSEDYAARIYCTARVGDWPTAALTYETAVGLDALDPVEAALLTFYLDPETIEINTPPAPPSKMSPLMFRLFEAAGNPLPTIRLPRVFAMADLRGTAAWRAEIEAAERLTQTGALPANQLLGLYTQRRPAASGGVWDRVRAIQEFDTALNSGKPEEVAATLPAAWRAMKNRRLPTAFAQLFADRLHGVTLDGSSQELAFLIVLLSDEYETASTLLAAPKDRQKFLISLAAGSPDASLARTSREKAIARGFTSQQPDASHAAQIKAGKIGQVILAAANQLDRTRDGSLSDMANALATLRSLGLEDTARRAALQILILGNT